MAMTTDPRFKVFCSKQGLDVFHHVIHEHQIWRPDPYDVDTIHREARLAYGRLLNRVGSSTTIDSGRILLILGEAGAGKTHLMRCFRNQTHEQRKGFFSYMQMTSRVSNYAQYVLKNTINSFDKPYYEPFGPQTGLTELSNALAESSGVVTPDELTLLREDDLSPQDLVDLIYPIADRLIALPRFSRVDIDVIQALLYLQSGQPAISVRVHKLLQCDPLTPYDSRLLGGIPSRNQEDDPLRMLQSFARLIQAVTGGAFVVCLDQFEEIYTCSPDEARQQFRRVVQTAVTLAEIPNVIVILSCLSDLYDLLKQHLPQSHLDRLEQDPAPIRLQAQRSADEVRQIIARRLERLYELAGISINSSEVLYPFPDGIAEQLAGSTTRNVLAWCLSQREHSIMTKQLPRLEVTLSAPRQEAEPAGYYELSQQWNDHLAGSFEIPNNDERDLLHLMSHSIRRCGRELGHNCQFVTQIRGDYLTVNLRLGSGATQALLIGLCQRGYQRGALARQIQELQQNAGSRIPVALRTTEFPRNPRTQTGRQIGNFLRQGGRCVQVADSDWRTMLAIQSFEQQYGNHPDYAAWLQTARPLSQLPSLQQILDLANLELTANSASRG